MSADKSQPDSDSRSARVLIVDDHPVVLQGLTRLLNGERGLTVVGEATNAAVAIALFQKLTPDVAIVDIGLDGRSGLDLIKDVRTYGLETRIIVFSMHKDATYAERALRAGAQGYIVKGEKPSDLISAVRSVLEGNVYVMPELTVKLLSRLPGRGGVTPDADTVAVLSDREMEVLELIGRARSAGEIAKTLNLSVSTIATHRGSIKAKLKLTGRDELQNFATGWVLGAS